jgi:hypothetical protein
MTTFEAGFDQAVALIQRLQADNDRRLRLLHQGQALPAPDPQLPRQIKAVINSLARQYLNPANFKKLERVRLEYQRQLQRGNEVLGQDRDRKDSCSGDRDSGDTAPEPQQQLQQEEGQDLEQELQLERQRMIGGIESQISEIQEVMVDTARLVHRQGEDLALISDQIFYAQGNVLESTREIAEASQHQSSSRKYVAGVSILALIVIALVLGLVFLF